MTVCMYRDIHTTALLFGCFCVSGSSSRYIRRLLAHVLGVAFGHYSDDDKIRGENTHQVWPVLAHKRNRYVWSHDCDNHWCPGALNLLHTHLSDSQGASPFIIL